MNSVQINNLMKASAEFKNICVNTVEFSDLLILDPAIMDPITDVSALTTGCFGYLGSCRIFVSVYVNKGKIMVSNYDGPPIQRSEIKWSDQFELEKFDERYISLKAFW